MNNVEAYRQLMRMMIWLATALLGGFYFPLAGMFAPLSLPHLISFLLFYTVVGNLLIFLYGQHQPGKIVGMTFLFTTLGLIARYLLSADPIAAGFSAQNILAHVITITIYVFMAYSLLKPAR